MPRQRSRSPLSPILATESATVRLFFILSVLLCSVNKAGLKIETWLLYCLRLRSRSPHNAKHSTSYNTRTILTHAHRAWLIDGLGRPAGQVVHYSTVVAISHRGLRPASCVIVSGFRAALDYYISP